MRVLSLRGSGALRRSVAARSERRLGCLSSEARLVDDTLEEAVN